MGNWIRALRRVLDYAKDPNPNHWRTINGAKVHLDASGKYDGGAQGKFNGRYHYGPDWKTKSALMNRLAGALHMGVKKGNQNNSGQQAGNSGTVKAAIKETNFPPEYNQPKEKKNIAIILDHINNKMKDKDPTAYEAYMNIGRVAQKVGAEVAVKHRGDEGAVTYWPYLASKGIKNYELKFPIVAKKGLSPNKVRYSIETWLHENMHALDFMLSESDGYLGYHVSSQNRSLRLALRNAEKSSKPCKEVKEYILNMQNAINEAYSEIHEKELKDIGDLMNLYMNNQMWGDDFDREVDRVKRTAKEEWAKKRAEFYEGEKVCYGALCDIYDALSNGRFHEIGLEGVRIPGHGKYYIQGGDDSRCTEMIANWGAMKMMAPSLCRMFAKDKPEVARALDEVLDEIAQKAKM